MPGGLNTKGGRKERELVNRLDGLQSGRSYHDSDWLEQKYHGERLSTYKIADRAGVSDSTIRKWMDRHGIERRSRGTTMKLHCRLETNMGGYVEAIGYSSDEGDKERVYIHRLLAVSEYGFDAVVGNDVHHINGVPWDNRPTNIELMGHAEHASHHHVWGDG